MRNASFTCFISVVFVAATDRLGSGGVLPPCSGVQRPCCLQVLQGTRAPGGLSGKKAGEAPLGSFYSSLGLFLAFPFPQFSFSQFGYIQNQVFIPSQNNHFSFSSATSFLGGL